MYTSRKLILGSGSPRRKELLEEMGMDFTVDTCTDFVEVIPEGVKAEDVPSFLARGKSEGFHRPLEENEILISADTIVVCNGVILGKPHTEQNAVQMLQTLSGRTHEVVSAICMRSNKRLLVQSDVASVRFKSLSEEEIDYYVTHYKPLDKAGAYGIQEWIGLVGIDGIEGSFYTIMGLPTHLIPQMLKKMED